MFARLGDVRLFFDVEGTKLRPDGAVMHEVPTVVCLHGGPGLDHSSFRPGFSPLAEVAQVVYLDQRGHGRSDPSESRHWTLDQWAADLHAFCDAIGEQHPVVIGLSFGGYVAMRFATHYPQRLSKLVLISTAARGTAHPIRRPHVLQAFERRGGPAAREAVHRLFDERTEAAFQEYLRVCGPLYNHGAPSPQMQSRTLRRQDVLSHFERHGGEGAIFDLTPELSRIACPTLVISGDDDPITPVEEQEAIVSAIGPRLARHVRFSRCGHGVLRDDAAGLLASIAEFVLS